MTLQFLLALLAVAGAALWFGRGLWAAAKDGGCASGCGGCGHRSGCPLPRLAEMQEGQPPPRGPAGG